MPRTILTVKSHINSQIYHRHKIKIAYNKNMNNKTRLGMLNTNPWSEILYQKNSQKFPQGDR